MDKRFFAAGLAWAACPVAVLAQAQPGAPPATAPSGCYVEVAKLMADPPTGIGDLAAAIREIDARLRPQVEEVNALKAQIARLEQRLAESASVGAAGGSGFEDENRVSLPVVTEDPLAEELQMLQAELQGKHDRLKLDYAEQRRALVGPVQTRVSERAQAFAGVRGCSELKMAREPDLALLTTAGSRDVTGEFVSWYLANKS